MRVTLTLLLLLLAKWTLTRAVHTRALMMTKLRLRRSVRDDVATMMAPPMNLQPQRQRRQRKQ
jgi:hypothetical protein